MFKLVIECSKDISSLSIDFVDGTSTVQTGTLTPSHRVSKKSTADKNKDELLRDNNSNKKRGVFLDTDADYSSVSQEVVQLPKIDVLDRPVNVALELQNLDF